MLPGFCTKPTDLASFKNIARSLGMALNERPDLRMCICQSLRTLINKSCETGEPFSVRVCRNIWIYKICELTFYWCLCFTTEDEKVEVSRFAKNFLPILFNIYSQEPTSGVASASRMAILDTVRVYFTITDQTVLIKPYWDNTYHSVHMYTHNAVWSFLNICSCGLDGVLVPAESIRETWQCRQLGVHKVN